MLWKTSWPGQEPAETWPCHGTSTPRKPCRAHLWEGEGAQTAEFSFGLSASGVETVLDSVRVGPELERKGRNGCVSAPRTGLAPSILHVFIF